MQVAVGQQPDADGDVHALLRQVDDLVEEVQVDFDIGIALEETGHGADDMAAAEDRGRRDAEQAARFGIALVEGRLGTGEFAEDEASPRQELLARVGQGQSAWAAVEQPGAEFRLQGIDLSRDRGDGDILASGHFGKAAGSGNRDEGLEGLDHFA